MPRLPHCVRAFTLSAVALAGACSSSAEGDTGTSRIELGTLPYNPLVHHLDLSTLAYQVHGQSLVWPFDPFYEERADPLGSSRDDYMANVRAFALSLPNSSELDSYRQKNPEKKVAPFAANLIVHRSNNRLEEDIREGMELRPHPPEGAPMWQPPVVRTIATEGTGATELIASIAAHRAFLTGNGLLEGVRQKRAESRLTDLAGEALLNALQHGDRAKAIFEAAQGQVQSGARSPRAAVKELMKQLAL